MSVCWSWHGLGFITLGQEHPHAEAETQGWPRQLNKRTSEHVLTTPSCFLLSPSWSHWANQAMWLNPDTLEGTRILCSKECYCRVYAEPCLPLKFISPDPHVTSPGDRVCRWEWHFNGFLSLKTSLWVFSPGSPGICNPTDTASWIAVIIGLWHQTQQIWSLNLIGILLWK